MSEGYPPWGNSPGASDEARVVAVSGGFDPLHRGHLNLFRAARVLLPQPAISADKLVVILDSDEWLARKHRVIQPQVDRAALLTALRCVDLVLLSKSPTDVSDVLEMLRPDVYAVGPDHTVVTGLPEYRLCCRLGIEVVCLRHLHKAHSSSEILSRAL